MIKLQVIGNLGKDAIVNNVNGKSVINFTVAHTEKYKDAQGVQKDRVVWVDCAYWTDRTAVAPYLRKGTQVFVEGNPDVRSYTTQDGRNGATLTLRVANIQLLGSKNQEGGAAPAQNYQQSTPVQPSYNPAPSGSSSYSQPADLVEPLDDLPF